MYMYVYVYVGERNQEIYLEARPGRCFCWASAVVLFIFLFIFAPNTQQRQMCVVKVVSCFACIFFLLDQPTNQQHTNKPGPRAAAAAVRVGGQADMASVHDRGDGGRLQLERRFRLRWGRDDRRLLGEAGVPARAGT